MIQVQKYHTALQMPIGTPRGACAFAQETRIVLPLDGLVLVKAMEICANALSMILAISTTQSVQDRDSNSAAEDVLATVQASMTPSPTETKLNPTKMTATLSSYPVTLSVKSTHLTSTKVQLD